MPAEAFTGTQVHPDAHGRPFIARSCVRNGINAGATVQGVRTGAALNDVVCVIAGQRVCVLTADNVLKPPETVPCRMPAGTFAGAQIHCDARGRPRIENSINAGAAVQGVCTLPAIDDVVPVIASQRVRMVTADKALKPAETIPRRIAAGIFTSAQVHRDARGRPCIGDGIHALAAIQGIRAAAAIHAVVAVSRLNDVAAVITGQRVRIVTADNALETPDTIPCRMPAGDFTSTQVHHHTRFPP